MSSIKLKIDDGEFDDIKVKVEFEGDTWMHVTTAFISSLQKAGYMVDANGVAEYLKSGCDPNIYTVPFKK